MAKNNAGGFAFAIDDWKRLDRFLVLGSEGGSYYVKEQELTIRNAKAVHRCIKKDGVRVVKRIVEISESGRAPKNESALFALAMCAGLGNGIERKAALVALPRVARIGTHLFHFVDYVQGVRGWGRSLCKAVAEWYNGKDPKNLAYQVLKYRQRDGWTHRDLLRLAHPKPRTRLHSSIYKWVVSNKPDDRPGAIDVQQILGFEQAQRAENGKEIAHLVRLYNLTREMIPTKWLNDSVVWEALLERMPMTAMIRNLGKMTSIGLIAPLFNAATKIASELRNEERIRKARVHPLSVLVALKIYEQGHGLRGRLSWIPNTSVIDALDDAFYLAFGNVEPTNKRLMLALDVSGSMSWSTIAGMPISPREATGALAMVTARTESQCIITAFSHRLVTVTLSPKQRLDDVCRQLAQIPMGGTDCALPMLVALKAKVKIDAFIILTDSETWAGRIHPIQALKEYRNKMGIPAKLIVVAMTSSGFSIADPSDSGCLDITGFDTATPNIISEFVRGNI